jgi:hypothetical protein
MTDLPKFVFVNFPNLVGIKGKVNGGFARTANGAYLSSS